MRPCPPLRPAIACAIALVAAGATRAQPGEPFAVQSVPSTGRSVAAELVDLDGDARAELLTVTYAGIWPDESRRIQVFRAAADGRFGETPAWTAPLPPDVGAYDVAPLDDAPGAELLLLGRDRVRVLSFGSGEAQWRDLPVPDAPTVAPAPDERGLDRIRLARPELGAGVLLVPGLGASSLLDGTGATRARLRTGGRSNYFIPPRPGPLVGESELEIYFDVPVHHVADVDGDGRADIVAANRHALRVFRQRADGSFPENANPVLPLRLVAAEDQAKGGGSVRSEVRDFDGDGRADLLISHSTGGLMRAVNHTRFHRNRSGSWNLAEPDQAFEVRGGVSADEIVDLDGDGHPEWLRIVLPLGLLDLAELFLQREVDLRAEVRSEAEPGRFAEAPSYTRSFSIGVDFEALRPRGFLPTIARDWNGDGARDLLSSGDGSVLEVALGGAPYRFGSVQARQPLEAAGRLRFGDLDADGLEDWVLYDPRLEDVPVRVGRNRGVLPGTPPRIEGR